MKRQEILVLIAGVVLLSSGIAVYGACYGATRTNGANGDACTCGTSGCCSYNVYTPTYDSCTTSKDSTGKTCNNLTEKYSGIQNQPYVDGDCVGGYCTGGAASGAATTLDPQPRKVSLVPCSGG